MFKLHSVAKWALLASMLAATSSQADSFPVKGKWLRPCWFDKANELSVQETLDFKEDGRVQILREFALNVSCVETHFFYEAEAHVADWRKVENAPAGEELYEMDLLIEKAWLTPVLETAVKGFNNPKVTIGGYDDWKLNERREFHGDLPKSFMAPKNNEITYHLLKVIRDASGEIAKLEFGDTDTDFDGSTAALRPPVIEPFHHYLPRPNGATDADRKILARKKPVPEDQRRRRRRRRP